MAAAACTVALIRTQRKARSLREGRREGQRRPAPILEPVQIDRLSPGRTLADDRERSPIARIDAARVGPVSHVDQHGSAQGFQRRIDEDELSYDKAFSRNAKVQPSASAFMLHAGPPASRHLSPSAKACAAASALSPRRSRAVLPCDTITEANTCPTPFNRN